MRVKEDFALVKMGGGSTGHDTEMGTARNVKEGDEDHAFFGECVSTVSAERVLFLGRRPRAAQHFVVKMAA